MPDVCAEGGCREAGGGDVEPVAIHRVCLGVDDRAAEVSQRERDCSRGKVSRRQEGGVCQVPPGLPPGEAVVLRAGEAGETVVCSGGAFAGLLFPL